MVVVAGILMLALSVFVVAYPFRQPSTPSSRSANVPSDEGLADLLAHRDATYAALKELELDYETGKLSSSDYQALRHQYRAQAVAILQELDSRQVEVQGQAAEDRSLAQEMEGEIASRQRRWHGLDRCPDCEFAFEPGDHFCRRCGAALREGSV